MTFLLAFWKPIAMILAAVALVAAIAIAKHSYDEGKRDEGRADIQAKWDADSARRMAQVTAQTLAWDAQRQKTDTAVAERDKARQEAANAISQRVANLPQVVRDQRVPAAFVGVLRDSANAANLAGTPGEPDKAPAATAASADAESDLGLVAGWISDVARIHAECRDRVALWIDFYAGLRAAQPKESPQ